MRLPRERSGLSVSTRYLPEMAIVDIRGEVDKLTSPRLRRELRRLTLARVPRIVVNLEGLRFMESSGVATLVLALKELRFYGGELRLASPSSSAVRYLHAFRLADLFGIYETLDAACE
jgi:anti-sigma B factor antagonist